MDSIQQIKSWIDSISGTRQITRSMRLVSTVRLRTVRSRMLADAPFFEETERMVKGAASERAAQKHRYVSPREAPSKCVVVVGGDRGLCGGYNVNVCREAVSLMQTLGAVKIVTVGQKIKDYFIKRPRNDAALLKSFTGISEKPFFEDAEDVINLALDMYENGESDSVYIVYTRFVNMLTLIPTRTRLLPLDGYRSNTAPDGAVIKKQMAALTRYEPGGIQLLEQSVPFYAAASLFHAILESSVCEQSSRITSMDSAVKNSEKMIESLTQKYNQARQGAITGELADILGGTKALRLMKEQEQAQAQTRAYAQD